eukprot:4205252-Amphidinium_carterae.1
MLEVHCHKAVRKSDLEQRWQQCSRSCNARCATGSLTVREGKDCQGSIPHRQRSGNDHTHRRAHQI